LNHAGIGLSVQDVLDPDEAGYGFRERRRNIRGDVSICKFCGGQVLWATTIDLRKVPLEALPVSNEKWLFRRQKDGTYAQSGSGPGYRRHRCQKAPV
jgi:hypothetical protein